MTIYCTIFATLTVLGMFGLLAYGESDALFGAACVILVVCALAWALYIAYCAGLYDWFGAIAALYPQGA